MFNKFIKWPAFLISLAIGLLFVYLSQSPLTTIYVYPTPDNIRQVEYKDKANNCFQFDATQVKCPQDKSKIKTIPIQN